tara:strand:+ start:357 stop:581 length:225 start_codon:yes stop_codon:yes gene_type:complete
MGLIKMKTKESQKHSAVKNKSIANNYIIIILSIFSLFFESIVIIISLFRKGILKKEVLSQKNNLGFDLIIKRKR